MAFPCGNRCMSDVIIRLPNTQFRLLAVLLIVGSMLGFSHLIATIYLSNAYPATANFAKMSCSTSASAATTAAPAVTPFSMAFVTIPEDKGRELAGLLVKNKLAACVNIVPKVTSIYEWKGKIQSDTESLMMIKTRTSRIDELIGFVKSNHPYEVCEVISTPIQQGNPAYLEWLGSNVADKGCF